MDAVFLVGWLAGGCVAGWLAGWLAWKFLKVFECFPEIVSTLENEGKNAPAKQPRQHTEGFWGLPITNRLINDHWSVN